jgi:hypothetical protein
VEDDLDVLQPWTVGCKNSTVLELQLLIKCVGSEPDHCVDRRVNLELLRGVWVNGRPEVFLYREGGTRKELHLPTRRLQRFFWNELWKQRFFFRRVVTAGDQRTCEPTSTYCNGGRVWA